MKDNKKEKVSDIAWQIFSKTGNISHYLFYKKLDEK